LCYSYSLSLHDALPICFGMKGIRTSYFQANQAKSFMKDDALISFSDQWKVSRLITLIPKEEYNQVCGQYERALFSLREELLRTRSEEHTSELQSRFDLV